MERVPVAVQCLMMHYLSASSIFRVEVVSRRQRSVVDLVRRQGVLGNRVRERLRARFSYGHALVDLLVNDPKLASQLPVIGSFPLQAINGEDWTAVDGSDCDFWALRPDAGQTLKRMLWRHHDLDADTEEKERQAMLANDETDYQDASTAYNFKHAGDPVLQIVAVELQRRMPQHGHGAQRDSNGGSTNTGTNGGGDLDRITTANAVLGDVENALSVDEKEVWSEIKRITDKFDWDWCKCAWTPTRFVIDGKAAIRNRVGTHKRVYHWPMERDYSQLIRRAMRYARRGYSGRFPDTTLISLAAPSNEDTYSTSDYERARLLEEARRFREFLGTSVVSAAASAVESRQKRPKVLTSLDAWAAQDECREFVWNLRRLQRLV